MKSLRLNLGDLEQYSRRNNIEIRGVPLVAGEDTLGRVNELAVQLDVPLLSAADIEAAHRLPSRTSTLSPSIIVRFKERQIRDLWLAKSRKFGNRDSTKETTDGKLPFLCENLTAANKALLWEARKFTKENGFAYVWVRNGRIYIRRADGDRAHRIKHKEDLARL